MAQPKPPRDPNVDFVEWVEKKRRRFLLRHLRWRLSPHASAADAEDGLQAIHLNLLQYKAGATPKHNPEGYLFTVMAREAADINRKAVARQRAESKPEAHTWQADPVDELVLTDAIHKALLQLPEHDRVIARMHHFQGMTAAEIARELPGATEHTVRRDLTGINKRLKEILSNAYLGKGK